MGTARDGEDPQPGPPARPWPLHRLSLGVLVVGFVITAGLAFGSAHLYRNSDESALKLRTRDAASVLSASVPSLQTALASAAEIASATGGNVAKYRDFISAYVGAGRPFVSASLWHLGPGAPEEVSVVGVTPVLAQASARTRSFFSEVLRAPGALSVTGFLNRSQPRLGYAFASRKASGDFVVYAEAPLSPNRRLKVAKSSAFADLNYAIYLGQDQSNRRLLAASVEQLPLTGQVAVDLVPFGTSRLTLVMSAQGSLTGSFFSDLSWVIALAGALLTFGATLLTERLVRRRKHAESLAAALDKIAGENQRLYGEQRNIAVTLQQALLPAELPAVQGIEVGARYVPGVEGVEIGGDWYDLVHLEEGHFLFVVGDVSGRGLRAATIMASLRYAVRAYAAQGDRPGEVLEKCAKLLSVTLDGHFATVLCGVGDVATGQVTLANAGHLQPLLIEDGRSTYVATKVGVPIGVLASPSYAPVTLVLSPGATLLAFTDGLVERRGENLDVGLARLQMAVGSGKAPLDGLLDEVMQTLMAEGADDTALLGIRWAD